MGLRYRKSINLGGGFRINLSKSGVGYSWGTKGYRVTKTAKGNIRKTVSIPGTGLSYTEEHRSKPNNQATSKNKTTSTNPNYYNTISARPFEIFEIDHLSTLSNNEFLTWSNQFIEWSKTLTDTTDTQILKDTQTQLRIIAEETERREKAKKNGDKIFKIILSVAGVCIIFSILVRIFA